MYILGVAIAHILSASPHHVPFAVISLDKEVTNTAGSSNIGETLIDTLVSGEGMSGLGSSSNSNSDSNATADSGNSDTQENECRHFIYTP